MRAYLLAAGRGRRAGGPKAWREHEGRPLLGRQIEFLRSRAAASDIAVSIQREWLPRCAALDAEIRWVPCDPDAPPLASLQALLRAVPPRAWFSLHHVDMPVWEPALWDALLGAIDDRAEALVPVFQGRRGHPVLLSARLALPLLALAPERDRLDRWLRRRRAREVIVEAPCALENWNEARRA